jgi:glycosyltransferase involved in cell wall biosynthesis
MTTDDQLRIVLTSYRSKPHSGGQGIYVRHLSRELAALGHDVEVISGPPYPELDAGPRLTKVASLDLYREPDPFRVPNWREFSSATDVLEFASMSTGAFPEPLTFTLRVRQLLAKRPRTELPDIVHDNQSLGYGLLPLAKQLPVVATVHHPITIDRKLELAGAPTFRKRIGVRRWYSFLRMQKRVARRLSAIVTVSTASKNDICRDFGVEPSRVSVVPLGVAEDTFAPNPAARCSGRIVTTASADVPLKGLVPLLEALAKVRTEHDAHLVVVGSVRENGETARAIERLDLTNHVTFTSGLSEAELVATYQSAHVAVVPSLYEGFSLPAVELMSCALPLVVTTAGALPEVVGPDRVAALHVEPGDSQQLAGAISEVLGDDELARTLGAAARRRVVDNYSWPAVARRTVQWYRMCIERAQNAHS